MGQRDPQTISPIPRRGRGTRTGHRVGMPHLTAGPETHRPASFPLCVGATQDPLSGHCQTAKKYASPECRNSASRPRCLTGHKRPPSTNIEKKCPNCSLHFTLHKTDAAQSVAKRDCNSRLTTRVTTSSRSPRLTTRDDSHARPTSSLNDLL